VRENTRAYKLGDTVSEEEKARRLSELIAIQERISLSRNRQTIGQVFDVLVEGPARRGNGMLAGKTPQFKTAVFPAVEGVRTGDTIAVRVESATAHSFTCSLV
jgi:tRNA-2-methylthio-N6-dimethylallyladenosine synthase